MVSRGYKEKMIQKEVVEMRSMTREEVLKKVEKGNKDEKINFITTHSGYLPNVNKILKTNMHHLKIEELEECIMEPPRLSLRRGRNLRDIVVDAKKKKGGGSGPCGRGCKMCEHMKERKEVKDKDGRTYQINEKMDCGTIGAIYGMHCRVCPKSCLHWENFKLTSYKVQHSQGGHTKREFRETSRAFLQEWTQGLRHGSDSNRKSERR